MLTANNGNSVEGAILLRTTSAKRVNTRLRRYDLVLLLLPNIFNLACLLLSSI